MCERKAKTMKAIAKKTTMNIIFGNDIHACYDCMDWYAHAQVKSVLNSIIKGQDVGAFIFDLIEGEKPEMYDDLVSVARTTIVQAVRCMDSAHPWDFGREDHTYTELRKRTYPYDHEFTDADYVTKTESWERWIRREIQNHINANRGVKLTIPEKHERKCTKKLTYMDARPKALTLKGAKAPRRVHMTRTYTDAQGHTMQLRITGVRVQHVTCERPCTYVKRKYALPVTITGAKEYVTGRYTYWRPLESLEGLGEDNDEIDNVLFRARATAYNTDASGASANTYISECVRKMVLTGVLTKREYQVYVWRYESPTPDGKIGYSYRQIGELIGKSQTTAQEWCEEVERKIIAFGKKELENRQEIVHKHRRVTCTRKYKGMTLTLTGVKMEKIA